MHQDPRPTAGAAPAPSGRRALRVALVNMPFSDWRHPSFALSQLASLARRELPGQVDVAVHYLNMDFARYFGVQQYDAIVSGVDHLVSGVGEWIFREVAFPGSLDNQENYFRRYYAAAQWESFRNGIIRGKSGLEDFCVELIDRYELDKADVVGLTTMFSQTVPCLALARLIKERNPESLVVLGGANCEVPMGAVLARNAVNVDYVFSGPALHSFIDFLRYVQQGDLESPQKIRGVLCRANCHDGPMLSSIGAERDIDDFFEPDYVSFISALESRPQLAASLGEHEKPTLWFETSRGCWWGERSHCTFCGLNSQSMNYRHMSPEVALRQFRWLFSFAPWCVDFLCTDNIMPKSYMKDVLPRLEPPRDASIFYEVKLPISESDMAVMAAARVNHVQPGIEALATSTLALMRKGTTAFLNIQFLKNCVRFGIRPEWNLLIGFPGEDPGVYEKYNSDIPLLKHLPPPSGVYMVRFDRYSPYFMERDRYQLDLEPLDYYPLIFPFAAADLADLAYYFYDANIGSYLASAAAWIGPLSAHVERWRDGWSGSTPRPVVALVQDENGRWAVHDSRPGQEQRVAVDDDTVALLRRLSSPVRLAALASHPGPARRELPAGVQLLREKNWLFEEDGRVISLVNVTDG
jgi:ribosomal peptide maturation radical SAM protein 1